MLSCARGRCRCSPRSHQSRYQVSEKGVLLEHKIAALPPEKLEIHAPNQDWQVHMRTPQPSNLYSGETYTLAILYLSLHGCPRPIMYQRAGIKI